MPKTSYHSCALLPGYAARTDGSVWTCKYLKRWRRLTPTAVGGGYLTVMMSRNGKRHYRQVSHIILETFIGPRPDGMVCRHLNGNNQDNRLVNLCWGTDSENHEDMRSHGTMPLGENHKRSKVTEEIVRYIRAKYATGNFSQAEIAKEVGLKQPQISMIVLRLNWKHVP